MTRILLIEDELALREEMVAILGFENFDVVETDNGETAIALALLHVPDLIICDITIPGMDGYAVLVKMRSISEMAQLPFILISARTDRSSIRQGMDLGADDYLTKPFSSEELLASVNARVKQYSIMKAN